jgi:hypothetical protein
MADGVRVQLFRSHAPGQAEMDQQMPEQIGEGHFDKMVRIALSDPDGAVWRYSIDVAGELIVGDDIRTYAVGYAD